MKLRWFGIPLGSRRKFGLVLLPDSYFFVGFFEVVD
jgi:hypothetical protein